MATRFADKPSTANRIKFTLAGYYADKDKAKALEMMTKTYDPKLVFAPENLDVYAAALLDQKKYREVQAIADKLVKDYPLPPNTEISSVRSNIAEPTALSWFYNAKVLQTERQDGGSRGQDRATQEYLSVVGKGAWRAT